MVSIPGSFALVFFFPFCIGLALCYKFQEDSLLLYLALLK